MIGGIFETFEGLYRNATRTWEASEGRNCGAKSNFPVGNRFSKVLCNLVTLY